MSSSSNRRSETYDITEGFQYVPSGLLECRCDRVYIEFLKVDTKGMSVQQANDTKNHAVFKIEFDRKFGNVTGVRIDMRLDDESASEPSDNGTHKYTPGDLKLKTTDFLGESNSSARTIKLRYNREQNLCLGDLLVSFMRHGVHLFGFGSKNDRYFGCRDFV